jgi:hypothetical protein
LAPTSAFSTTGGYGGGAFYSILGAAVFALAAALLLGGVYFSE